MRPLTLAIVVLGAVALALTAPGAASAQEFTEVIITGRVEHGLGTPDFDPTSVVVTLNVLEGITSFDQVSAVPAPDGSFSFDVVNAPSRTYFLGVEYQGARYSASRTSTDATEPVIVRLFDATHDASVLRFDSYSIIVAGADRDEGWVEIIERASIRNDSGLTLTPDQMAEGTEMPGFLRFGLPPGYYNLDVRSNLIGGDVLEVDRGFALTTPIPPTEAESHLFEFVYRLRYGQGVLDLSRTMRFGVDSLRFVAPDDVAFPIAPQLQDLGATELNGRLLRLLEGENVDAGALVALGLSGLPLPTIWTRLGRAAGDYYVTLVVPAAIGAALVIILVFALRRRRVAVDLSTSADPVAQRASLLAQAAALEARRDGGALNERRYESERADIKRALVDLSVNTYMETEDLQ
jgi:hypothetical protein